MNSELGINSHGMEVATPRRNTTKKLKVVTSITMLICVLENPDIIHSAEDIDFLQKKIEQLQEGQKTIQKDLQEIKRLLGGRVAMSNVETTDVVLNIREAPVKGRKDAKLVIVEFSDYECPYCARYVAQTFPLLEKDYVTSGRIKYVLRDFPLEAIHPNAFKAAEAARCALEQGQYWQMHDRIFASQKSLNEIDLSEHARAIGINTASFEQCLKTHEKAPEINKDIEDAHRIGVKGTPTFFLGFENDKSPAVKAVRIIRGAVPYKVFKETIDALILESDNVSPGNHDGLSSQP